MKPRAIYLTLFACALLASASLFVSVSLVFGVIADELGGSLLFSVFLPLIAALPFILIARSFFAKAKQSIGTDRLSA